MDQGLSFIERVSLIEGIVECIMIMFGTDSSVHYKENVLLRVSVKREFTAYTCQPIMFKRLMLCPLRNSIHTKTKQECILDNEEGEKNIMYIIV